MQSKQLNRKECVDSILDIRYTFNLYDFLLSLLTSCYIIRAFTTTRTPKCKFNALIFYLYIVLYCIFFSVVYVVICMYTKNKTFSVVTTKKIRFRNAYLEPVFKKQVLKGESGIFINFIKIIRIDFV
jgi:hypothetical protein